MLANARQVVQGLAARHQIVLRQSLEPVDGGAFIENRLVVIDPQTKPETQRWASEHLLRAAEPFLGGRLHFDLGCIAISLAARHCKALTLAGIFAFTAVMGLSLIHISEPTRLGM